VQRDLGLSIHEGESFGNFSLLKGEIRLRVLRNLEKCGGVQRGIPCQFAGQRRWRSSAFKIEVMLSGVPSRAKAGTERSRSIPWQHTRRQGIRPAFHGILRLRAAPPSPSRHLLRMTSDFVNESDKHSQSIASSSSVFRPFFFLAFAFGAATSQRSSKPWAMAMGRSVLHACFTRSGQMLYARCAQS